MRLLTSVMIFVKRCCICSIEILSSFTRRSTLLMNKTGRTRSFSACRMTVSVCGMIPSTASTRMMTPSIARIARVTSPPKST